MQRNIILVGIALFTVAFLGVVFFKKPGGLQNPSSISSSISPTAVPSSVPSNLNITVVSPKPNDAVQFPIIISGQARVFENQLNYRITDEKGKVLSQGNTTANAPDAGQFGPYTITISSLGDVTNGKIIIEAFDYSAKDGSEIDKVTIPVTLQ